MAQPQTSDDVHVVQPECDIVASTVESFRQELLALARQGEHHIAIDLANVDIIDSKGLALFMLCHRTLSEAGGRLTVVTDNQDFRQLFHVTRMDEHFTIAESLASIGSSGSIGE